MGAKNPHKLYYTRRKILKQFLIIVIFLVILGLYFAWLIREDYKKDYSKGVVMELNSENANRYFEIPVIWYEFNKKQAISNIINDGMIYWNDHQWDILSNSEIFWNKEKKRNQINIWVDLIKESSIQYNDFSNGTFINSEINVLSNVYLNEFEKFNFSSFPELLELQKEIKELKIALTHQKIPDNTYKQTLIQRLEQSIGLVSDVGGATVVISEIIKFLTGLH